MNGLLPRRFELGELVQVEVKGISYRGRIFSYEDGRNLKRSEMGGNDYYDGWVYEVTLYNKDGGKMGRKLFEENQIEKTTEVVG